MSGGIIIERVIYYIQIQYKQLLDALIGPGWSLKLTKLSPEPATQHFRLFGSLEGVWCSVASWDMRIMPGCCAMCVSFHGSVYDESTKRGLGTLLNRMRIDMARMLGYGVLICTDVTTNEPSRRLLKKNGWKQILLMKNPRTGNLVHLSVIELVEGGIQA